ncbi:hypothetical protein [Streptomyces sp. NPDC097619]|uniref:hypothetical protein n=1 Tax=Streptomyces sp. NPDC097619 TaxID=3157228 RepID=UPI0033210B5D
MTTDSPRPRPLRTVTATAGATGSALAVVLLPLVLGALTARAAGGDPMASVNALIAGGGQRAGLSPVQLRTCRDRALARLSPRRPVRRSAAPRRRRPLGAVPGPARTVPSSVLSSLRRRAGAGDPARPAAPAAGSR